MHRHHAAILLAALLAPAPVAGLEIPVLVQRLLPEGIPGSPGVREMVSAGIPFAAEEAVHDVSQLGMRGTSAAQFRVLQRDPESGHVTWVLATFLADGGPYAVTDGRGAFGGADLAHLEADRIVVETGSAHFEIRTRGFNGIDRAVVGADEIVPRHDTGGVVLQCGPRRYESSRDPGSEVVVESNGPASAVVRASGRLRDASGAGPLAYTVRLRFDRGATSCRASVTLRNADVASLQVQRFDAAWFEVPLALVGRREVTFGFPGTGFAGWVPASGSAHLFQGDNVSLRSGRTEMVRPELTTAAGLEVEIAGETYNSLGTTTDVAQGWGRVRDARHAVLAGMRDLAAEFPSGFDLRDDVLAVEMFSRHNPKHDLIFSWGAHETRELLFEFGGRDLDAERFRAQLQYPLIGRCNYARYRDTGAIWGERRLVTAEEESGFFADLGKTWQPARPTERDLHFDRSYSFGTTGGGNQFDQDECHLIDFLRTGAGGSFMQGRFGTLFKADQAVYHSDDFDFGARQNGVSDVRVEQPKSFHGKGAGNLFDDEHPHWTCMALYYHLTGDEHVREAIEDYGEWRLYRAGNPAFGALHGGALNHFRLWSRCLRDVALLYDTTGQARYLQYTRAMAARLTGTIETRGSIGRNLDRGYFFFGKETEPSRRIHLFFLTEMNAIGVQAAMRVLPAEDPLKEELRDYLYGLGWFTLQEAQIFPDAPGYPYEYNAAAPNTEPGARGDQTGLQLALGYEMSGDPEFATRSRALAWRVPEYQHPLRASELPEQVRIWRWLHRDQAGAALVEPRSERNADGSWTLRWTAPPGAQAYVVKYGPRPLVENLGFDPVRRTFRIDPSRAMNFWAARNVQGEPAPGRAGSSETWRTPVLPPGAWHFGVKVLGDRPMLRDEPLRLGDVLFPGTRLVRRTTRRGC